MLPALQLQSIGLAHGNRIEVPDIRQLDWREYNRYHDGSDLNEAILPEKNVTFNVEDRVVILVLEGGAPD